MMKERLAKVLKYWAADDHENVVRVVADLSIDEIPYKMLFFVGQSHVALSQPALALPYLVRAFYFSPSAKRFVQIRKLALAVGDLSHMDDIVAFVFDQHQEDADLISFVGPFLPEVDGDAGLEGKDGLIAFYALAERGRSREAVAIGRRLIAAGEPSPALRARMANLLFGLGEADEALRLETVDPIADQDWRQDIQPVVRVGSFTPGIIFVADVTALGDFLQRLTIASKAKANAPKCHVAFCYRPDRGFKDDLVKCALGIDEFVALDDLSPAAIEAAVGSARYRRSAVLDTDSSFLFAVGDYRGEPWLRIPAEDDAALAAELAAAGVDPTRWFATLHYRQGNSAPTPHLEPLRDVQAGNFHDVAHHIIEQLGGQVVRLGHPGMDKLPPQPGYIDLSEASIMLQLFATARSRFMMGTDSGMVSFAVAFAIPTGRTNVTYDIAQENPADIILLKNLISLDGYAISTERQFHDGKKGIAFFRYPTARNFKIVDNTPEQLRFVADALFDKTRDVDAWRDTVPPVARDERNQSPFPMDWQRHASVIDLADMVGLPVRLL